MVGEKRDALLWGQLMISPLLEATRRAVMKSVCIFWRIYKICIALLDCGWSHTVGGRIRRNRKWFNLKPFKASLRFRWNHLVQTLDSTRRAPKTNSVSELQWPKRSAINTKREREPKSVRHVRATWLFGQTVSAFQWGRVFASHLEEKEFRYSEHQL